MEDVKKVLKRGVQEVLPNKDGLEKLMSSKKIRVYLGIDPTGARLHLGHTIPMRKLQQFAELGHEAILLFGTGTVLAGDPSQRREAREKITQEEINENIKTWKEQASKIIDLDKVQIRQNGEWLLKLTYEDIINIASRVSSVQLFKREMFQRRIEAGDTVFTHETLYPLFQGYDSVALDVDLEIGGTDQVFNMLVGRELLKKMKNKEKYVLITPLISGTDGKQMSKSSRNCIWLDDSAGEMYGKIMSMQDSHIGEYAENLTDLTAKELEGLKPIEAKKKLAFEIVKIYNGAKEAQDAQEEFERVFQKREVPEEAETVEVEKGNWGLVDFLTENNLVPSRSEAKRLIDQGAIEINGKTQKEHQVEFKGGEMIKIGKKKFVKIKLGK